MPTVAVQGGTEQKIALLLLKQLCDLGLCRASAPQYVFNAKKGEISWPIKY